MRLLLVGVVSRRWTGLSGSLVGVGGWRGVDRMGRRRLVVLVVVLGGVLSAAFLLLLLVAAVETVAEGDAHVGGEENGVVVE